MVAHGRFQSSTFPIRDLFFISKQVSLRGIEDFRECLVSSDFFDLGFRGYHFTWTDKSSLNPKARKLGMALVNKAWQDSFPDSNASLMPLETQITLLVLFLFQMQLKEGSQD